MTDKAKVYYDIYIKMHEPDVNGELACERNTYIKLDILEDEMSLNDKNSFDDHIGVDYFIV